MKTSKTFSLLFWLYTARAKNNQASIYARVTINGRRVNISLKHKADIDLWDPHRERLKGTREVSKRTNQFLDSVQAQIVQIYQDLRLGKKFITPQLIKSTYLGEDDHSKTLQELINYHHKKIKTTHAPGTIRNFGVTINYINRFLKNKRKASDVFLKELNYAFICDFEYYLHNYWPAGHPRSMSHNTVMKHLQRLRKIATLGYHLEWTDRDPFIQWKPIYEKTERGFLSANELSNLEHYRFPIDRLDRVRDLFVFSCYTGLSYSDVVKLTPENLIVGFDGEVWISTKRQKTKSPVNIPLLTKTNQLISKYRHHPITMVSGTLLPVISNEKLNLYLKEVAEAAGIKKNLTFHMARHTFATTVTLSNGVPIETVSKLLGHSKISSTQIYARVVEKKISQDMNVLKGNFGNCNKVINQKILLII